MIESSKIEEYAKVVLEILSDVYEKSLWNYQQIVSDMEREDVDYFFVSANQSIVGFLAIQDLVGEVELTNIAVKTAYQGQHLADQLFNQLIECGTPIFLEVRQSNTAAIGLYQKYGFKEIGLRRNYYHNPIEDAILMKREV
jgi:ribosomal-protein-alanine N-acetyltransferase